MSGPGGYLLAGRVPRPRRRRLRLAVGLVLLVTAVLGAAGPALPVALFGGLLLLVWAASSPRFGVTASVVASLLIPLPLAFKVGSFSLTIGRLIGFAFLVGWVASLSRPDGPRLRRTGFEAGIFAFLAASLVSLTVNSAGLDDRTAAAAIRGTLVLAVDYFAFFFAAVSVLRAGRRHLDRVLRAVAGTVTFMGGLGLIEKVTGKNVFSYVAPVLPGSARSYVAALAGAASQTRGGQLRIQSTTEGPNEFGAILVMAVPLMIHYSAQAATPWRRIGWLLSALVCVVAGFFTQSRSVVVCFLIDLVIYGIVAVRSRVSLRRLLLVGAAAVVFVVASPGVNHAIYGAFRQAVTRQDTSVSGRQFQAGVVVSSFAAHPIAGTGPETLSEQALIQQGQTIHVTVDNYYLATLGEEGLLGIVSLVLIVLGAVALGIKRVRAGPPDELSLGGALLAAMASWAVLTYLFDSLAFYGPSKLWLLLLAALVALGSPDFRAADDRSVAIVDPGWMVFLVRRNARLAWGFVGLGVIAAGIVGVVLRPPFQARTLVRIDQPALLADPATGLNAVQKGMDLIPTFVAAATSDTVLRSVASAVGWQGSLSSLRNEVSAAPETGLLVMSVTAVDHSATRAVVLSTGTARALAALSTSGTGETAQVGTVLVTGGAGRVHRIFIDPLIAFAVAVGLALLVPFVREYRRSVVLFDGEPSRPVPV